MIRAVTTRGHLHDFLAPAPFMSDAEVVENARENERELGDEFARSPLAPDPTPEQAWAYVNALWEGDPGGRGWQVGVPSGATWLSLRDDEGDVRANVAEWGDHPTFRVHGKNFVFSDPSADHLSSKLTKEEAAAVVVTDAAAEPTGYGLGRHGWVSLSVEPDAGEERWTQIAEWVRTSYTLLAPKKLARLVVLIEDGLE